MVELMKLFSLYPDFKYSFILSLKSACKNAGFERFDCELIDSCLRPMAYKKKILLSPYEIIPIINNLYNDDKIILKIPSYIKGKFGFIENKVLANVNLATVDNDSKQIILRVSI